MTPQELRKARWQEIEKLLNYFVGADGYALGPIVTALDNLDALDTEYTAAQSAADALSKDAYYSFIRQLDRAYDSLKQAEGVPSHEIAAIDLMVATLVKRAEMLKGVKS